MAAWWTEGDDGLGEQTLESMPYGLLVVDDDWVVRYLNDAGAAVVGYDAAELVGRDYWSAFPANLDNHFGEVYRRVMVTGRTESLEAFYPAPLQAWFEVQVVRTARGLALYFSDVTERHRIDRRLALLARASELMAGDLDVTAAVQQIPRLVVPLLGDWASVTLLDSHGVPESATGFHHDRAQESLVERWAKESQVDAADAPWTAAVTSGTTVSLTTADLKALARTPAGSTVAGQCLAALTPDSVHVLPLRARGTVLGVLSVGMDATRTNTSRTNTSRTDTSRTDTSRGAAGSAQGRSVLGVDDLATAVELADRLGLALDNTRLYNAQARMAETLQRSMLTHSFQPDHAEIAVRYLPATAAAQIGGDWYDAFQQAEGATNLVIGDVVGHDVVAAADMGQLRSLLRGIAVSGNPGPARVLDTLDTAMTQLGIGTYATVGIARVEQSQDDFDQAITRLRWASAGHLPPVVVDADGHLVPVPEPARHLMLGIDHTTSRDEVELTLGRGSTALLFTDGLVERPGEHLDIGVARLQRLVADLVTLPLEEMCDQLLHRLVEGRPDDDVALVAVRLHAQDRLRPAEAGPSRVPENIAVPDRER